MGPDSKQDSNDLNNTQTKQQSSRLLLAPAFVHNLALSTSHGQEDMVLVRDQAVMGTHGDAASDHKPVEDDSSSLDGRRGTTPSAVAPLVSEDVHRALSKQTVLQLREGNELFEIGADEVALFKRLKKAMRNKNTPPKLSGMHKAQKQQSGF